MTASDSSELNSWAALAIPHVATKTKPARHIRVFFISFPSQSTPLIRDERVEA
jgi:hypothetical protein